MNAVTWETLSRQAETLSLTDQSRLSEHLTRRIRDYFERTKTVAETESPDDFAAMAADPEIQRDMRAIQEEFACADADGIHLEDAGI